MSCSWRRNLAHRAAALAVVAAVALLTSCTGGEDDTPEVWAVSVDALPAEEQANVTPAPGRGVLIVDESRAGLRFYPSGGGVADVVDAIRETTGLAVEHPRFIPGGVVFVGAIAHKAPNANAPELRWDFTGTVELWWLDPAAERQWEEGGQPPELSLVLLQGGRSLQARDDEPWAILRMLDDGMRIGTQSFPPRGEFQYTESGFAILPARGEGVLYLLVARFTRGASLPADDLAAMVESMPRRD